MELREVRGGKKERGGGRGGRVTIGSCFDRSQCPKYECLEGGSTPKYAG